MKGYVTANGYMGLVEGRYVLFACEADYREYMEENQRNNTKYSLIVCYFQKKYTKNVEKLVKIK